MDHQIGPELERLLEVWRGEGVIDGQFRPALVGDSSNRRDIEDLQERVGWRLNPHELGFWCNDLLEGRGSGIVRVARGESPGLEDFVEQTEGPSVEIGGSGNLISRAKQCRE